MPHQTTSHLGMPYDEELCRTAIQALMDLKLIRPSRYHWASPAFYVNKHTKQVCGKKRLVIDYRKLNDCLQDIRYPIPCKTHLLKRMTGANVFSNFDMKSSFWQIGIKEHDRHKTTFVVPHGHYEWNVMPFGLKNASSEFQNRMDEVYRSISGFCLIYIDDAFIFSNSEDEHVEYLSKFNALPYKHGLALSE